MPVYQGNPPIKPDHPLDNLPGGSFLAVVLHRLVLIGGLLALFVPFFGPVLDHHFAERQPFHIHVYPSGNDGHHHVHFYEQGHSQSHEPEGRDAHSYDRQSQDSNIIYLTSDEGWSQGANSVVVTTSHVDVLYPPAADNPFLPGSTGQDPYPLENFVAPPKKPPRV